MCGEIYYHENDIGTYYLDIRTIPTAHMCRERMSTLRKRA
jgi:hypothetical protein